VILDSHQYLIICESAWVESFKAYGTVLGIPGMPAVVNTGQLLTLKTEAGTVIHCVEYSDHWYERSAMSEGGWSLEMKDPENPCAGASNWSASIHEKGGTPGKKNSISMPNADILKPKLLQAALSDESRVMLVFSERMDSASFCDPFLYSVNKGLLHPEATDPAGPQYTSILLSYATRFSESETYTIHVLNSMHDCAGNTLEPNASAMFAFPKQADSLDIVINEILFDATGGRQEFVEFYNRSQKTISMDSFAIEMVDAENDKVLKHADLVNTSFLLFPDRYAVIARDISVYTRQNSFLHPETLIELPGLFSLPDDKGCIALKTKSGYYMDKFCYSENYHSVWLNTTDGISLERTDPWETTNNPFNWHSASTLAGYATPGSRNSQNAVIEDESFFIDTELISPDNDGINDAVALMIRMPEPGYTANVVVFNASGQRIRTLASLIILGTQSLISWDGTKDDGTMAEIGIYLIYVELYNSRGSVKKDRKIVTLARD
jgi:hypothetical protein